MNHFLKVFIESVGFPGGASDKEPTCQCKRCKRHGFDPWVKPLQYSCQENPMDKGAWRATVHGAAKSWTRLKWQCAYMHWICDNIASVFYVLFCWPQGTWDFSSSTRDWTPTPCIGRWGLNHWTAREIPSALFLKAFLIPPASWPIPYVCVCVCVCV